MARATVSFDCEGPCCCRCDCCKGIGYWSKYQFTFPASNTTLSSGAITLNGTTNWLVVLGTPLFGSQGGTGQCGASQGQTFIQSGNPTLGGIANLFLNIGGSATLLMSFSMSGGPSFQWSQDIYFQCVSYNCRTGGTFVYDHQTTSQIGWSYPFADYTGVSVSVTPDTSSTWQQCGQNADGTDIEIAPPPMLANFMSAKTSLDVIERKERCDFYEGRDEDRPGCNGWLCAGKCSKGISQCMPGIFCQTCEDYEVDPDYEEFALDGWFM